jgi:REP element-mobilizing transposase RayT
MCRGNRQAAIFRDAWDNERFVDTLGEACARCGWRVHAFVLMGNHYHLLMETPHANLAAGMRWLQSTYTKRFNVRHREWGHLFQGRYKALLVDSEGDYFLTVSNYIHLNPARATGFDLEKGSLRDYPWSSYRLYLEPERRPDWLAVDRTLGNLNWVDDEPGRAMFDRYMQHRVMEISCADKPWEADERWAEIRQDWCFGGDRFREKMVEALDGVIRDKRRDSFTGEEVRKHDALDAERLFQSALVAFSLSESSLAGMKKSDPRKKVVAWLIRKNTSVRNDWIAERVRMGCVSNMSQYVRQVDDSRGGELFDLRRMLKK